jgi:ABC-type glutathione transport system ATPase component
MTAAQTNNEGLAVEVRDLRKAYAEVEAVRGVSFEVRRGEVFCLLGPNGAGKTTIVEILEGYRTRTGGDAHVLGLELRTVVRSRVLARAGTRSLVLAPAPSWVRIVAWAAPRPRARWGGCRGGPGGASASPQG